MVNNNDSVSSGAANGASSGLSRGPDLRNCCTKFTVRSATSSMVTVIRFSVSVPVLSEQMTVTEPRVSTAGSLRIRARRLSIRCAPNARAMVTTAGNPSGTAATARLIATMNIVLTSFPCSRPIENIRPTRARAAMANPLPN